MFIARRRLLLGVSACLLAGCGSPPKLKGQSSADIPASAVTHIVFLYQNVDLAAKTVWGTDGGEVILGDTGFYGFGDALVRRSAIAFATQGMTVVHAVALPAGNRQLEAEKVLSTFRRETGVSVLTVTPKSGTATGNRAASNAQLVFDVRLTDLGSRAVLWKGEIDTYAWKGHDLLNKNVKGNRFDETYADQFLSIVAKSLHDRWK